jgi:hypothetical protein
MMQTYEFICTYKIFRRSIFFGGVDFCFYFVLQRTLNIMSTLLLLAVIILVSVLIAGILSNAIRRKSVRKKARSLAGIVAAYALVWAICYFRSGDKPVPFNTDICFDDWCATVEGVDTAEILGMGPNAIRAKGVFMILHVRMSNHARGIAQKPSEPRIHIVNGQGELWAFSAEGQKALENTEGKQKNIGERLELHESKETKIVFDIPRHEKGLKALIEEGPFITAFLLPEDREIFLLNTAPAQSPA